MDHGAIPAADAINHLIQELSKLPGIGPKSAQRITYHLLRSTPEQTGLLSDAIRDVKQKITLCSTCYNVTDINPCSICRNEQRDRSMVCRDGSDEADSGGYQLRQGNCVISLPQA